MEQHWVECSAIQSGTWGKSPHLLGSQSPARTLPVKRTGLSDFQSFLDSRLCALRILLQNWELLSRSWIPHTWPFSLQPCTYDLLIPLESCTMTSLYNHPPAPRHPTQLLRKWKKKKKNHSLNRNRHYNFKGYEHKVVCYRLDNDMPSIKDYSDDLKTYFEPNIKLETVHFVFVDVSVIIFCNGISWIIMTKQNLLTFQTLGPTFFFLAGWSILACRKSMSLVCWEIVPSIFTFSWE